jgi:hypothetical protein
MGNDLLFELPPVPRRKRGYGYKQVIKGVRFCAWHPRLGLDGQACRTWSGLARQMAHWRERCRLIGCSVDGLHFRVSDDGELTWRIPTAAECAGFVSGVAERKRVK